MGENIECNCLILATWFDDLPDAGEGQHEVLAGGSFGSGHSLHSRNKRKVSK